MTEQLINITQVRDRFKCSTSTVYRWIERDLFPKPIKIGGMARWSEHDLDEFVKTAVKRRGGQGLYPKGHRAGRPPYGGKPKFPIKKKK